MKNIRSNQFEGWYFSHQKEDNTLAFIPGHTSSGAFIQVIAKEWSHEYHFSSIDIEKGVIKVGNCRFSKRGCRIDLPGIMGHIHYTDLTPLNTDIMGPFQYLPMQCRHGILSMHHHLSGAICFDHEIHDFTGGHGYIEMDSGTSFPKSYLWIACNDFDTPCAMMVSIAHIPFGLFSFTGCICAIIYKGQEYRFATYHGVRVLLANEHQIRLLQGNDLLEIDLSEPSKKLSLASPVRGQMNGSIRESNNVSMHVQFWHQHTKVFDLHSAHALYEYVP